MSNNINKRNQLWRKYGGIVRKYNLLPISHTNFPAKSAKPLLWEAQYEFIKEKILPLIKEVIKFDKDDAEQTYMILSGETNPPILRALREEIKARWAKRYAVSPKVEPTINPLDELQGVLEKMGIEI